MDHFGRVCCVVVPDLVSLRFEFSFMNCSSFEPTLGSFWSYATWLRPPSRFGFATFEFGFKNGLSFEPDSDHWSRMLRGCSRFGFATFEFGFMNGLKFRANTRIILVAYATWLFQIRFRYVSNLVS